VYGPKLAVLKDVRVSKLERRKSNEFGFMAYVPTGYGHNGLCVLSASTGLGSELRGVLSTSTGLGSKLRGV
jgi:hypothetical protein